MQQTYTIQNLTIPKKIVVIQERLDKLGQQIADYRAQIVSLETAGTCTGYVRWRKDKGRTPKMRVHHDANTACPVHGEPPANGRLRVYVGLDPARQAEVNSAIERHRVKTEMEQQIEHAEIQIAKVERAISSAYYAASNSQRWEM